LPDAKLRYSFEECRGECIRVLLESDDDHPFVSDYLKAVAKRITVNLAFPWESIQRGPEGDVGIRFRIDRKGQLVSKEILKSSGVRVLDDTALDSIVKGAPFSPFPPSPYIAGIGVRADFRFRP
jgi:TonB family protein